jgi:formate/nitrite transporter FocA (FNT family)
MESKGEKVVKSKLKALVKSAVSAGMILAIGFGWIYIAVETSWK